jgi:hypothetical protein
MDKTVTDAELNTFYGFEISKADFEAEVKNQIALWDGDDLCAFAYDKSTEIFSALNQGDVAGLFLIFLKGRVDDAVRKTDHTLKIRGLT